MANSREYFARAEAWSDDTRAVSARSRRVAWLVAGVAIGIAAFEAVALAMLAPLKTVQPVTLLVDRNTGYVQAVDPLTPQRVSADEALTRSLLAQYIVAREGFDRATVATDYRRVALWSTGRPRQTYLASMPATNPDSPFQRVPAGTRVRARVKSVSRLSQGIALVRFDTSLEDAEGRAQPPQPWVSVVRFRYVDAPMSFEDRLQNPLGFQVTGYRRDAEAPPPPEAVQQTNFVPPAAAQDAPSVSVTATVRPATTAPVPAARMSQFRQNSPSGIRRPTISQGPVDRREVPISNIPMGSPLGPPRFVVAPTVKVSR